LDGGGVFQDDEVSVMLWQRETDLGNGHAPIGEQALAKRRIDPGFRHDACSILWIPLF